MIVCHRNHNIFLLYEFCFTSLFCTIMAISRQKEARSRDYVLLIFQMTSRVLYSAQYHRQHCTLHAFEQFGALYMHNHDDKYPSRPGFELGTPRLQAPADTNEPLGPAIIFLEQPILSETFLNIPVQRNKQPALYMLYGATFPLTRFKCKILYAFGWL